MTKSIFVPKELFQLAYKAFNAMRNEDFDEMEMHLQHMKQRSKEDDIDFNDTVKMPNKAWSHALAASHAVSTGDIGGACCDLEAMDDIYHESLNTKMVVH